MTQEAPFGRLGPILKTWIDGVRLYIYFTIASLVVAIPNIVFTFLVQNHLTWEGPTSFLIVLGYSITVGPVLFSMVFRNFDGAVEGKLGAE